MQMSKQLKRKIILLVAVVVASMLAMGIILYNMQSSLSLESYSDEMSQQAEALPALLESADSETEQNTESFDGVYQSKAEIVAFMANNNVGFEVTNAKMIEYQELLGVDNIMIVSRDGAILAQATDTKADFAHERFNQLRDTFSTGKASDAVEIELAEEEWLDRYYACMIDSNTMVVIEQRPEELRSLISETGSLESVLADISLGQSGFVMAVSSQDYIVDYHPDSNLIGTDALDGGIDVESLEDGTYFHTEFGGESLYCYVTLIDGTYYLVSVPDSDMANARAIAVGVTLFVFLMVMVAVVMYGVFVMRDDAKKGHKEEEYVKLGNTWAYNRTIGKKATVLSVVGFVLILVVTFYMQTLFALSSQSTTNNQRAESIAQTIETTTERASEIEDQYSERYLAKAEVFAYIIEHNSSLANKASLEQIADALDVNNTFVFDSTGNMIATSDSYTSFTLSTDPEDQSYGFRVLLQGVDSLVQEPQEDDSSGEMRQYVGVATYDDQGYCTGFVNFNVTTDRLESMLESVQIDTVLSGVQVGTEGFAFAVNKSDGTIAYYPNDLLIGKSATSVGLTEDQLKDGYSDYLTIEGTTYYASSVETDNYYLYVAGPEGELMEERVPLTLVTGGIALVCLIAVFLVLTLSRGKLQINEVEEKFDPDSRTIDVVMADGRVKKSESAVSRWLGQTLSWDEMTPEKKLATVMRAFMAVFVVVVFVAVLFRESFFSSDSVFQYILSGEWERGLNVFAVTASLMFACVAISVAYILQKLLGLMQNVTAARGETMCRLASSIVKYGTAIGMLYYCLALLGVDTATLLASAGLLSLAISFGAKDLVNDIISGLFIIFEGEFRVGDIIEVGSFSGTVMDIGIRTTKIDDGDGNVQVLRNSDISNVLNKTKQASYASVDFDIEYGESLERIENILSEELHKIHDRLPAIIDGPFYKGVVSLSDNSVVIRIVASCKEENRGQLTRDLNREVKLMFDRYDITVPYMQVVLNQPTVYKDATAEESRKADAFNEEQKELAEDLGNDNRKKDD